MDRYPRLGEEIGIHTDVYKRQMVPFSYILECGGIRQDTDSHLTFGVEQLAVGLLGNGEVEVKAVLAFNSFLEEPLSVENIQEVEMEEADPLELSNRPGLVGCVIREGDDLWGLAKRYHATVEGIRRLNGLEEDTPVKLGEKLLIFKENMSIRCV